MDRLEIEKRALKGRTFESEDGESRAGAAQIRERRIFIFSALTGRIQMRKTISMIPVTTFPGWEGTGGAGG